MIMNNRETKGYKKVIWANRQIMTTKHCCVTKTAQLILSCHDSVKVTFLE